MGEEQFDRVQQLFLTALELPAEQRESWLHQQCGDDQALLEEILSLLKHDSPSVDPLEKPLNRAIDLDHTIAGRSDSNSAAREERTQVDDVQFLSRLTDVEILSSEEISKIERDISAGDPSSNPHILASQLVTEGKLTAYQADSLLKGQPKLLIDKYLILDLIDIGGMGTVFKAIHRPMNRIVAIKMISKHLLASTEQVQRFLREVRVAATLEDLNVVCAYDADQFNDTHFLVMEYVRGENLAKRVARDGPLSVEHAVNCILQAASGFRYAHRRGVVHRDIKPSNLMQAEDGTVKVLDLGLANVDDSFRVIQQSTNASNESQGKEDHSDVSLTQAGDLLGTASFMAPEQSRNAGLADPRSDVYSLGCTFYFLLMGEPPYRSKSVLKVLAQHRDAAIPSVRDRRPDVPPSVDAICSKMLAKEPNERFQTMGELIAAIEDCGFYLPEPGERSQAGISKSSVDRRNRTDTSSRFAASRRWSPLGVIGAIAALATVSGLVVAGYALSAASSSKEQPKADAVEHDPSNLTIATQSLYLNRQPITDAELARRLVGLTELKELHLYDTPIGDEGLVRVGECRNLEKLYLGKTNVTSKGLSHLRGLRQLRRLWMENTRVDDFGVDHVRALHGLEWLNFGGTAITDAGLKKLEGMEHLLWLSVANTKVTDAGIRHVGALKSLKALFLHRTSTSDSGLGPLVSLDNLLDLDLSETEITDVGLVRIGEISTLKRLHLGSPTGSNSHVDDRTEANEITKINGTGLTHLSGMVGLEKLCLGDSLVDDVGLSHLPEFNALKELYLSRTLVTDAGMVHLAKLKNLRVLHLVGTQVTDEGLAKLKHYENLRLLWLYDTRVTDAGIDDLKQALPACVVRTRAEDAKRDAAANDRNKAAQATGNALDDKVKQ